MMFEIIILNLGTQLSSYVVIEHMHGENLRLKIRFLFPREKLFVSLELGGSYRERESHIKYIISRLYVLRPENFLWANYN